MEDSRKTIILVDDNLANLNQGKNILKPFYRVFPAPSSAKLFETLENIVPDLILLDIEMPEMNGYETIRKFKADPRFKDIPVIFLTSMNDEKSEMEGFDLGAVDYMTKPFSAPLLLKRIANQLLIVDHQKALKDYAENLEIKVNEKTAEVINLQNAVLATVSDLVEFRDKQTGGHIARTQRYMKSLIEGMVRTGLYSDIISRWDISVILLSAQLHDVGKIAITDLILNKPAKLTNDEFEIMKTHVVVGVDAIKKIMSNA
ncbi:MAG: response regulator, partial [Treponema sp.]|nr:response regulator [Treponema sp.]